MPIYQTARYQVEPEAVAEVKAAIEEFVRYVRDNEPGTLSYAARQQKDDPTRFVQLFTFEDDAARRAHGRSEAVKKFQSVYSPRLLGGPVVFTDSVHVATNR